uniref:Uncharacterized protein n=1 Tax=Romanomermis culicivorax TaxID=13658 RepID=A0A915K6Q2_ROMCU
MDWRMNNWSGRLRDAFFGTFIPSFAWAIHKPSWGQTFLVNVGRRGAVTAIHAQIGSRLNHLAVLEAAWSVGHYGNFGGHVDLGVGRARRVGRVMVGFHEI